MRFLCASIYTALYRECSSGVLSDKLPRGGVAQWCGIATRRKVKKIPAQTISAERAQIQLRVDRTGA
jgi:hypothetical protein